jgi:hypothetical protein
MKLVLEGAREPSLHVTIPCESITPISILTEAGEEQEKLYRRSVWL